MTDAVFAYVTASSLEEATKIADALVDEQLVACANILPGMQSVYRWNGEVQHDNEVVVILKTRAALVDAVVERVRALHSYECPCVVTLPLTGGNPAFLAWIQQETREPR